MKKFQLNVTFHELLQLDKVLSRPSNLTGIKSRPAHVALKEALKLPGSQYSLSIEVSNNGIPKSLLKSILSILERTQEEGRKNLLSFFNDCLK